MLKSNCLSLMKSKPTRTSWSLATFMDIIFMPISEYNTVSGKITCDIYHNFPVFVIRKSSFTQSNPNYQSIFKSFRNTKADNVDELNEVLSYRLSSFGFLELNKSLIMSFLVIFLVQL